MIDRCNETKALIRMYNLGGRNEAIPPIALASNHLDNKKCECGSKKKYRRCCKLKKRNENIKNSKDVNV